MENGMLAPEIVAQIRDLEIAARRAAAGLTMGDNRTKRKGSSFEFDALRDYAQGDDIRYVDWKSSARAQKILTRQYLEDRQKTVILLVDISQSIEFGSRKLLKSGYIKQLAGLLAFIALYQKDAIGLILFSDQVELVVKPGLGRAHVLKLVNLLFTHRSRGHTTDINKALETALHMQKKEACLLLISDLYATLESNLIAASNCRHELVVFRCTDPTEAEFPRAGILTIEDRETGAQITINTDSMGKKISALHKEQDVLWKKMGIPTITCQTHVPLLTQVTPFLKKYMRRK